jgi:predicted dehydrogenase
METSMKDVSRRDFIKTTGAAGAAVATFFIGTSRGQAGPNDRVRHAVIGVGGQGRGHCRAFDGFEDCDVVAICDVDPTQLEKARKEVNPDTEVKLVSDFHTILEDPSIDSVSVATPDHWHTPVALWALAAGKHVYVEKPCAHNVREAQLLGEAATKTGKCVQHGTQARSSQGVADTVQALRDGIIGKVRLAKAINHQLRGPIGRGPDSDPPSGVDYDRWLGPAPVRPWSKNRWHYHWHWHWDYGTGDIGNDGVHQIDVARWGLGVAFPKAVSGSGGQLFYDDDHETPDTQIVTYEYDDCYLIYEMRLWTDYKLEGQTNGIVYYGDTGTVDIGSQGCFHNPIEGERKRLGDWSSFTANVRNFVDCVKANDPSGLKAPISEAFPSVTLCHLGNIVTRVGRRIEYDSENHRIPSDEEADKLLTRTYRKGYELPEV